ncbi:MAG: DUF7133 domain-containing protein [Roseibacillus sp.]
MNKIHTLALSLVSLANTILATAADKPHAVIVCGTYHYSPHKTMPPFAAELERLGFKTTVINPDWDPEKDKRGLPGIEALADADVGIFFTRFLKLDDQQLGHITSYLESGKPVVGFRTSTHGFKYPKDHPQVKWNNDFGKEALGTPYRIHLAGSTNIKPVEGAQKHPILTGVEAANWKSPGTLYLTDLQEGTRPLLVGTGKAKRVGTVSNGFGTHELKAEMTDVVAWTWQNKWDGRTFTTSLGHVGDFAEPNSMRVMVNGVFWAAGQEVPSATTAIKTFQISGKAPAKKEPAKKAPAKKPTAASYPMAVPKIANDGVTLFYGNSFVERLQEDGTFEALLQSAQPNKRIQYRSLAYTGDEVGFRIRPSKFGEHLAYFESQYSASRVMMCFGMNESFAGIEGLPAFEKNLSLYLNLMRERHPKAELVLVSPTAIEPSDAGQFPDPAQRNADLALYTEAMRKAAANKSTSFIDLFTVSQKLFADSTAPLTDNGLHLNQAGNRLLASEFAAALTSPEAVAKVATDSSGFESLRQQVSRKAYEVAMAYKPANGIHYYGVRGRDFEYSGEIPHHFKLANQIDQVIWKQASNLQTALPLPKFETAEAKPPAKKPRKGLGTIQTSEQDLAGFTVADGFEVNLFASSEQFPELINPLQIQFDARGRLWVCCFASYPVPLPGELANDTILIFEDTDGDGQADKRTVFADGLKLPDGFVFYKDGIVAAVARKFLWLRDTDGDDKADLTEELLRGADDTDTHHGGFLARTPQGDIIIDEALFHRGQFETPHGPLRTKDAATIYFDPATRDLRIIRQTTHPNPWKISYATSGDSFHMFGGGQIIDCDFYNVSTPVGVSSSGDMGMPFRDDKGNSIATVTGSHFPKEWQGGVLTAHLLGKNAVLYTPLELQAGTPVKAQNSLELLTSKNKVFRPVDLRFGLDGALYVSDFYYPIIGHAQHSIRDRNRDYKNGRIWRVTKKGSPLSTPPQIEGASLAELFTLLTHPQIDVREIVRGELENHPNDKVLAFAKSQVAAASSNEDLGVELLYIFERLKDFSQSDLYRQLAASSNPIIRRSAARVLHTWASALGSDAQEIASKLSQDSDERTQLCLLSSASYLQNEDPFWGELIQGIEAKSGSPIDKMKQLAALNNMPPLGAEFPLLKVSSDSYLTKWIKREEGIGGLMWIESDQNQSAILGYTGSPVLNLNVNDIPITRATGSQHTKDGQVSITLEKGLNKIEFFSALNGKPRKNTAKIYLTSLTGGVPSGVTHAANEEQHKEWASAYEAEFATVTDDRIYIKTIPSQLAFNVTSIRVKAGQKYNFVFKNDDHMLHNLVVTQQGADQEVGALADAMAAEPDAMERHYIPDTDLILFATPQIPYGKKVELPFTAPTEPGTYPILCTFPGHWRLMKGEMIVE